MAWTSKTTEEFKNGNGSNLDFTFSFEYLQQDDVKVQVLESNVWVDKAVTTDWTFHNATTIRFNSGKAPANATRNVRVYRDTEIDAAKAVYAAGSSVRAKDLNDNQDQLIYALQEEQFNVIIHDRIDQGAITNTNVSPIAEIEVSKLKDGTARQLLQTDTAGTGVEWTSNVDIPGTLDVTGAVDFDSTLTVDGTSTLTGNVTVGGTVDGRDVAADGTKLDTIETGATADQTAAEIRTLVGNATDSQVFTDADHTKLDGIETGATADQTNAEIRTAVEAATDSNVFTDADHTKLDGIAAGAEVNVQSDWNASSGDAQILNKPSLDKALNDLTDVSTSGAGNGKILKHDGTSWVVGDDASGSGGSSTFTGLSDTPANFSGAGGKTLAVKSDASGVEFVTAASAITVQEEGSALSTAATTLNFVGANVTASGTGATKTITVSGVTVQDEGGALSTAATTLNFVGAGVEATGTGATKTITISGSSGSTSTDFKYLELKAHNNASGAFSAGAADYELVTKGTTTAITPAQAAALIISIGGVIQEPNTGNSIGSNTGFCIDGSSIHFGANLAAHPDFIIYLQGAGVASIADNTVTGAKIALGSDAAGDIMYYNGTDYARLGVGSAGQMLQVNSGANAPEWTAAPSGTTNLSNTANGTSLTVESSSGNNTALPAATTSAWGVMTDEDKTKLDGVATGATATPTTTRGDIIYRGASADARLAKGTAGHYLKMGADDPEWAAISAGTTTFVGLTDTPANFTSSGGKFVAVNSGANALEYVTAPAGSVADGCIYENDLTISNDHTIAATKGAHSVGPITVNATVTVNGNWVIS